MDMKKLQAQQFEVSRALRTAHHLARTDILDTEQAIKELAAALASIAIAIDQLIETAVEDHIPIA